MASVEELEVQVAELQATIAERDTTIAELEAQLKISEVSRISLQSANSVLKAENADILALIEENTQAQTILSTAAEISELLDNNVHISPMGSKFNQADGSYKLVDISKLKSYLSINPVYERTYVKEFQDCDDFSFILQGDISRWDSDLAFGIIWGEKTSGGAHARNWCIGDDKHIWFVEPQTDKVFSPEEYWDIWWAVM